MTLISLKRRLFVALIIFVSVILFSCDSSTGQCDYFEKLLPNSTTPYVVMKIDIHCKQCIDDLQVLSEIETEKVFFITSKDNNALIKEKISGFDQTRFILVEDILISLESVLFACLSTLCARLSRLIM